MTEIPDQMKRDNWTFYAFARSNDPTIMIPYTRKLVSNLINSMRIAEETKYNRQLEYAKQIVSDAWREYSEDKETKGARAMILCETALDEISYLLYDKRWAIMMQDSFKYPGLSGGK